MHLQQGWRCCPPGTARAVRCVRIRRFKASQNPGAPPQQAPATPHSRGRWRKPVAPYLAAGGSGRSVIDIRCRINTGRNPHRTPNRDGARPASDGELGRRAIDIRCGIGAGRNLHRVPDRDGTKPASDGEFGRSAIAVASSRMGIRLSEHPGLSPCADARPLPPPLTAWLLSVTLYSGCVGMVRQAGEDVSGIRC